MTRVVVVGNGMVGSRFADELTEADGGRFRVSLLGAESAQPCNRVLLSQVVAGEYELTGIGLPVPASPQVEVHADTVVVAVDREDRLVTTADGARHRYDFLVLATGAAARVPPLPGLDPRPRGVHPLRTIDDAREIVAATLNARRAVVLGAGVLGVETAVALARRGLAVTVVHPSPALMDRQLDPVAAGVLGAGMTRLGIGHRVGVRAEEVVTRDGTVVGLRLDDRSLVPADLLVLCTGTTPATDLARGCGLPVRRGVVVDDELRSPGDRRVFAIGDCAEPPEGATGLIAQGWEQASRLADTLRSTGTGPAATPRRRDRIADDVVRVKADGLDVVTMGVSGAAVSTRSPAHPAPGHRVLQLSDPDQGRHVQVVVSGGRLVGATCLGDPEVAAELLSCYVRQTPLPADPARLLLTPLAATGAAGATGEPSGDDVVCRCNNVTRRAIDEAGRQGARTAEEVAARTRAGTGCGGCRGAVCALVEALGPPADASADHQPVSAALTASTATR